MSEEAIDKAILYLVKRAASSLESSNSTLDYAQAVLALTKARKILTAEAKKALTND